MPPPKLRVTQDPEAPVEKDVLAQAIVKLSKAATDLKTSGLNEKAIVVLLAHSTGFGHTTIKTVLAALRELRKDYCN